MQHNQQDLASAINNALTQLGRKVLTVRELKFLSWGNREECESIIHQVFASTDKTISQFTWLAEYNKIVDWMTDTGGKGLFLTGDVGRGKSNIILNVVPVLLYLKNKKAEPIHADRMNGNLQRLLYKSFIIIDELGTEPLASDYGERYEAFNVLINHAEERCKPIFISTNMDSSQLTQRYGERTLDRIDRLAKIVKFSGKSLRDKN